MTHSFQRLIKCTDFALACFVSLPIALSGSPSLFCFTLSQLHFVGQNEIALTHSHAYCTHTQRSSHLEKPQKQKRKANQEKQQRQGDKIRRATKG